MILKTTTAYMNAQRLPDTHKFLNLHTMCGAEVVTAHKKTTGYMMLRSMKRSARNNFSKAITLAGSIQKQMVIQGFTNIYLAIFI